MNSEKKQEFSARVATANRSGLVVILYDMILEYITEAEEFLQKEEAENFKGELEKARECVKELVSALDMQYQLSTELARLYLYVNRTLTKSIVKKEKAELDSAKNVIAGLRESFVEVAKQDNSPALMQNAQEIYAGITYGKHSLNENLSDQGGERGFFV